MTKAGFYLGDPYAPLNKHYPYHGINRKCPKPPDPDPFYEVPVADESGWFVYTVDCTNIKTNLYLLDGSHAVDGSAVFIMRGFEYRPVGADWYLIVYEVGTFTTDIFSLNITI
jgi:hypothetical protein